MRLFEAEQLAEQISFLPNWEIDFDPFSWDENMITLRFVYEVPDSDVVYAPNYRRVVPIYSLWPIRIDDIKPGDSVEFYRRVFNAMTEVMIHEMREFFAVGPRFEKPFHPHTPAGQRTYNRGDVRGIRHDDVYGRGVAVIDGSGVSV
jgi:hypothetical protein